MKVVGVLLLAGLFSMSASCETGRIGRIRPGMTRTDVAVELGRPAEVHVENEGVIWIYPASEKKVCSIKFVDEKVVQEPMKCDESPKIQEFASKNAFRLPVMNSEIEYQGRVKRYCGVRPTPRPGCQVSEQCTNGGWEEVCQKTE
jgi:hypothetical protein